MNDALLWLTGFLAAILGAMAALFRRYYHRPQEHELDDFSEPLQPDLAPNPPVMPTPTPTPQPEPPAKPQAMLKTFCLAIRDHEGSPPRPGHPQGDANYRNNNPGNFRRSPVGYAAKYGNVRTSPNGFAIFPTYELGWLYLTESIKQRAKKHPSWTIYDFFANYAPTSDGNDPKHYAEVVAKRCGVVPQTTLAKLFA